MSSDYIFRNSAFGGFKKEDVMNYITSIKEKESVTAKEIEELKKENAELTSKLTEQHEKENSLNIEISALKEQLNNKNAEFEAVCSEYEEKLREQNSRQNVEEAVGSAMIDVRRYADMLLQETCEKINTMSDNADNAAAKTLTRVLDISAGIQAFSDKLNSILADIISENENICRDLTVFKGSLKLPFETATNTLEAEILNK